MTLIKSISGIRGTIGREVGDNLTPLDVVKFTSAYGCWIRERHPHQKKIKIVVGRDARISGLMVKNLAINTLIGLGIDVVDLDLSTTPTVEVAVPMEQAQGGIIITASHNPKEWNALKLLDEKGEFIDGEAGQKILDLVEKDAYQYALVDDLGNVSSKDYLEKHLDAILNMDLVAVDKVQKAGFKVVVDAVNSTGGIFVPALLAKMGVACVPLYCEPTGHFPHNPEPLKEHLSDVSQAVVANEADFGIVVDPDVDRLVFINEDGTMFGEEYSLVACADYVLGKMGGGCTVSNLSSSKALQDITEQHGGTYHASAVGEVNVVKKMKDTNAVIGGEGNGGIIYPASHYGRDALVGIALFLSHLATEGISCRTLRNRYPNYFMSKQKIALPPALDVDALLAKMAKVQTAKGEKINTVDGLKVEFEHAWALLRKSNTEPIIRIYTEAPNQVQADDLAHQFIDEITTMINA